MGKDGCRPVLWPPLGVARALMFPEKWLMSAGAGVYSIQNETRILSREAHPSS